MSTLRKTVLTTAIIGAGLASTAGSAFATDCGHEGHHKSHESSHSSSSSDCTNNVAAKNVTKAGSFANVLGGAQTIIPVNVCHNLNNNKVLSDNSIAVLGSATSLPGFPGM